MRRKREAVFDTHIDLSVAKEISSWTQEKRDEFLAFLEDFAEDPWRKADAKATRSGIADYSWYTSATWKNIQVDFTIFDDGGFNVVTVNYIVT